MGVGDIKKDVVDDIINIILILFGLFIAYQLIRAIFGGSWIFESLVVSLLIFNLGISWKLNSKLSGHLGWHKGKDQIK